MSNVALEIGGRRFTVACAAGEESHVSGLGRMIDGKLAEMGEAAGQSESRMLLYAALLLADELHERGHANAVPAQALPPETDTHLSAIAERLENLAGLLEAAQTNA